MDHEYINEIKEIGGKDAKDMLFDYAKETFDIQLKKNKSFENMKSDLEQALNELKQEPMPEENSGMTTSELIKAMSKVEDAEIIEDEPEIQLLVDSPVIEELEVIDVQEEIVPNTAHVEEQVIESLEPESKTFVLPENYSPHLHMLGNLSNAYVILPWWIYDWILQTPNWKETPNSFPNYYGIDTILSLIYYIKRDGFVRIRETRNSSFAILD